MAKRAIDGASSRSGKTVKLPYPFVGRFKRNFLDTLLFNDVGKVWPEKRKARIWRVPKLRQNGVRGSVLCAVRPMFGKRSLAGPGLSNRTVSRLRSLSDRGRIASGPLRLFDGDLDERATSTFQLGQTGLFRGRRNVLHVLLFKWSFCCRAVGRNLFGRVYLFANVTAKAQCVIAHRADLELGTIIVDYAGGQF